MIEFWMDKTPVSLNKTLRAHWSVRQRERQDWMIWLKARLTLEERDELRKASGGVKPENPYGAQEMTVEIHVVQPACLFDQDNLEASVKPLLDAMGRNGLGLIWDDAPRWLRRQPVTQELARETKQNPGTRVRIGPAISNVRGNRTLPERTEPCPSES